jgi:predicted HAD superfamily Cof-like phosphohydrolase
VNKQYEQVKAFHEACGVDMPSKPKLLSRGNYSDYHAEQLDSPLYEMKKDSAGEDKENQVLQRSSWILEELTEFMRAETIEDQADALGDLIYFAIGTYTLMGIKPEQIFDIIHAANMGKVGPDGKVIRNEQGKIVKPANWQELYAPEAKIKAEIGFQLMEIEHDGKIQIQRSKL